MEGSRELDPWPDHNHTQGLRAAGFWFVVDHYI
ncbi:hypothetical protein COLO4_11068 [Corchorus olitorius]|uniref:Uncharacterized protein n=1 Tax=Corchorus olitorius TaxID=93759 RepID=A0A1R3K5Y4_9ROSI|nr:hypothetical protein COLO4_11068 [Corchorus olitorius]